MDGEGLFHADAIGDPADGDRLLDAAVLLGEDGALKDLDTLAGAFLDLGVDTDGVADVEAAGVLLELAFGQMLDEIHR